MFDACPGVVPRRPCRPPRKSRDVTLVLVTNLAVAPRGQFEMVVAGYRPTQLVTFGGRQVDERVSSPQNLTHSFGEVGTS